MQEHEFPNYGPWVAAKISRAQDHLVTLAGEIRGYLERNADPILREIDPQTGEYVARVHGLERPPLRWSIVIGEFLHNIHSALEHTAWLLASGHSAPNDPPEGTGFPIFYRKGDFNRTDNRKTPPEPTRWSGLHMIRGMSDTAQTAIKELQPYTREERTRESHPLWLLHELSNTDKHQAIHVVGAAVEGSEVIRSAPPGPGAEPNLPFLQLGPLKNGAVLARFDPATQMDMKLALTLDITFHDAGAATDRPVIAVLLDILGFVIDDVMGRIGPLLDAQAGAA